MSGNLVPINDVGRLLETDREQVDQAISRVLESGWLVHGEEHGAFESELAAYVGSANCVGVANGTDALKIALQAVGVGAGDTVATVANAGFYAATACLDLGAHPLFVDISPDTLTINEECLAGMLAHKPKAIVVTHLYGRLVGSSAIWNEFQSQGIAVIEDCAQAIGARSGDGRMAGTFGDVGCFSFYPTKNLAALGDGGAIVTDDAEIAQRCRELRQYGWTTRYTVARNGSNSRLDELQAAILRTRLPHLDQRNERRRKIAATYQASIPRENGRLVFENVPSHVAHLAVVQTPCREEFRTHLEARGVMTDVHYPIPDDQQPLWSSHRISWTSDGLETTHRVAREIFSIPCFPELEDEEIERVVDALQTFTPPRAPR